MSEKAIQIANNAQLGVGLLGVIVPNEWPASAITSDVIAGLRLEEIERRILAIEAALRPPEA